MIALHAPRLFLVLLAAFTVMATPAIAQTIDWEPFRHPDHSYAIDLPVGLLASRGEVDGKLVFQEPDGLAQLSVYSEANPDRDSIGEIAASLERSEWVREVSYRKSGDSWLVMSGYYRQDSEDAEELIFYVKLMMSPDRSRYAVFAISYPLADKARFDPVVERLESSFRPPR